MMIRRSIRLVQPLILLAAIFGPVRSYGQPELAQKIEGALRTQNSTAVHDFGQLLQSQGTAELAQEAARLKKDGLNFRFVTVPRGTADVGAMAESVYRDLKMGTSDVLIVFDGQRVYGKSLALQGEPEAFRKALDESRAGFNLDPARGLAQFAQSIDSRVVQRRHSEVAAKQAGAQRVQVFTGISIFIALLVVLALIIPPIRRRIAARKLYANRLQHAERLYERIALKMPDRTTRAIRNRFLHLDRDLQRARKGAGIDHVDRIIADSQALERDLQPAKAEAGIKPQVAESEIQVEQTS